MKIKGFAYPGFAPFKPENTAPARVGACGKANPHTTALQPSTYPHRSVNHLPIYLLQRVASYCIAAHRLDRSTVQHRHYPGSHPAPAPADEHGLHELLLISKLSHIINRQLHNRQLRVMRCMKSNSYHCFFMHAGRCTPSLSRRPTRGFGV